MAIAKTRVIAFLVLGCLVSLSASGQSDEKARFLAAYNAAIDDPWNDTKISALLDLLPTLDGYYLVEGDLPLTRREVQRMIVDAGDSRRSGVQTASPGELIVITVSGVAQLYPPGEGRKLTYAIDMPSFEFAPSGAYEEVRNAISAAGTAWEDLCPECGIEFLLDESTDPEQGDTWFIVRYKNLDEIERIFFQGLAATAFFPHDITERRYLNIYPSYFEMEYDRIGLFRHELGHVLGYRHEQTRGVKGCTKDRAEEEVGWKELTDYDPRSVMHYVCGGRGDYKLEFTASDREGHRRLYMPDLNEN
jgi:hypothetical protein